MLQENIRHTVEHELKTDRLDVSLFEKIIIQFFFTPNNPWGRCLMYTLEGGILVAMFALIVTMVSNAMLNILYISSGSNRFAFVCGTGLRAYSALRPLCIPSISLFTSLYWLTCRNLVKGCNNFFKSCGDQGCEFSD